MFKDLSIDIPEFDTSVCFSLDSPPRLFSPDYDAFSTKFGSEPAAPEITYDSPFPLFPASPSMSTQGSLSSKEKDMNEEVDQILKSIPTKELKRQRVHKSFDQKSILE